MTSSAKENGHSDAKLIGNLNQGNFANPNVMANLIIHEYDEDKEKAELNKLSEEVKLLEEELETIEIAQLKLEKEKATLVNKRLNQLQEQKKYLDSKRENTEQIRLGFYRLLFACKDYEELLLNQNSQMESLEKQLAEAKRKNIDQKEAYIKMCKTRIDMFNECKQVTLSLIAKKAAHQDYRNPEVSKLMNSQFDLAIKTQRYNEHAFLRKMNEMFREHGNFIKAEVRQTNSGIGFFEIHHINPVEPHITDTSQTEHLHAWITINELNKYIVLKDTNFITKIEQYLSSNRIEFVDITFPLVCQVLLQSGKVTVDEKMLNAINCKDYSYVWLEVSCATQTQCLELKQHIEEEGIVYEKKKYECSVEIKLY